jgi:hypothetical protein
MKERLSLTTGWPITGRSRRMNVRQATHVIGGLWPDLAGQWSKQLEPLTKRESVAVHRRSMPPAPTLHRGLPVTRRIPRHLAT